MRFLSVCSGLEGASLALDPLGWSPVGFAEIEAFPSAIISARYGSNMPGEPLSRNAPPNFGDFTAIDLAMLGKVDLLIGGTPCQAFSIAGKRLSLADARGNLSLAYVVLAHELARFHGLRNCIWENVPGVLNTEDNAFGCFLGALVGHDIPFPQPHGAGWPSSGMADGPRARCAWRVLDAQYFGLAQRRERVFVVAEFGDGADPAALLFESASLRGNLAPSRKAGERVAGTFSARTEGGGGLKTDFELDGGVVAFGGGNRSGPVEQAATLTAKGHRSDFEVETFVACQVADSLTVGANQTTGFIGDVVAHSLTGEGFDASEDGTGRGTPIVPVLAFTSKDYGGDASDDMPPTLRSMGHDESHANGGGQIAVAFQAKASASQSMNPSEIAPSLDVSKAGGTAVAFDLRGREGGAQFEGPHDTANIRAASGGSSRSYVATNQPFNHIGVRQNGELNAYSDQGNTAEILRALREEIGAEAFTEWGLGIFDSFQSAKVLRQEVHGGSVRRQADEAGGFLGDDASSRAEIGFAGALHEMRRAGRERRAPQGWKPSEQRADELNAALSLLPQHGASADSILLDLWQASEGLGILRQALSEVQKIRRPAENESQSAHTRWAVRRLTPREAERLQGVPDNWTKIAWRGKPAELCPDGPRYRALGNSWAVPVVAWIARRLTNALNQPEGEYARDD